MKYLIGFFIGVALVLIFFWLSGFDFDERGPHTALIFFLSLIFGCLGASLVHTISQINDDFY